MSETSTAQAPGVSILQVSAPYLAWPVMFLSFAIGDGGSSILFSFSSSAPPQHGILLLFNVVRSGMKLVEVSSTEMVPPPGGLGRGARIPSDKRQASHALQPMLHVSQKGQTKTKCRQRTCQA
ncbi:hypothetical protein CPAR01_08326 [Colletotrichum paranaense]|uniref:Uncharacterized protein n=2 Tax=Colletotrichum acutatum species complex TaxID=2707335 RepID=A0ABQ9SL85_9PEZI|nr:uncharacterized protein CPAR01_08326 [Colletotrichum paranaense]XP_060384173.1 uncharacterized protein CTAM01_05337 [Colletotrichum tamarilloi]KAK1502524.1 hypothetical protein CTAM01_05337 [Colletotrichum tamarilloi]KAK1538213.1 hypothetical protein CPAR01_08326 [Colletotrichum paranaense]